LLNINKRLFRILKDQKAILITVCLMFQSNQIMHLANNQEILNNLPFLKYLIDIMMKKDFQKYLNYQEKALKE
jgi:hypothetical protein